MGMHVMSLLRIEMVLMISWVEAMDAVACGFKYICEEFVQRQNAME
jgi:hypothetical protein